MRFLLLVRLTLKLLPNELALPWSYKLQKRLMFLLVCYVANGGKSTGKTLVFDRSIALAIRWTADCLSGMNP